MTFEWQLPNQTLHWDQRPLVMGIVNVTPDSFSDGGRHAVTDAAVAHGLQLVQEGADLLDIGGESSRPGAMPVSLEEELRRVLPVIEQLATQVQVPLSVDTYKAETARACLAAGAQIVNDITGLTGDPAMPEAVRAAGAGAVVMHMQGTPATMQLNPQYDDVVSELRQFFEERLQILTTLGIAKAQLVLDPGIGFGKTFEHNVQLLARLEEFQQLGRPLCLGVSRKRVIGQAVKRTVEQRLAGSLAALLFAQSRGAVQIARVHDVAATRDALTVFAAIQSLPE
jgi:dihydropteroate synthase